jgi:ankyrin repeat protein
VAWYFSAWRTLFFYAIGSNNVSLAKIMLELGTDPNRTMDRETPLTLAARDPHDSLAMVRLLLEFHADPNLPRPTGQTPLGSMWHGTAYPSNASTDAPDAISIAETLLAAGANIKACNQEYSLLEIPSSIELAKFLLSRGADPNQVCDLRTGQTPLHNVVDCPDLVALYLEHGAKIVSDTAKVTPLHLVAETNPTYPEIQRRESLRSAEILLAHGADVNAADNSGMTALDNAYEKGNKDIADLLIKHGGKSLKFKSMEEGEESHAAEDEYQDLYMFPEGRRNGPACSLNLVGESRNIMEEGHDWSIVKGTVAVVHVNCHASGFFHYVVLGMGPPVPKRLNMPLMGGIPGSEKITFDQNWSHGIMHWYYSKEPITNLVKALKKGTATHFAVRNITVGE